MFGDLLYNRYVFDMPRLYDFVRVYYPSNATLVSKAVGNVFRIQPAYYDDLAMSAAQIINVGTMGVGVRWEWWFGNSCVCGRNGGVYSAYSQRITTI